MTTNDASVLASVLGFLGSLVLFYPGWRVSRSLKTIERLRAVVDRPPTAHSVAKAEAPPADEHKAAAESTNDDDAGDDPGPELVRILEEQHAPWRPLDHWLLVGGILLIALSFAADLFLVRLAD